MKLFLILVICSALFQCVAGSGKLEIRFHSYSGNGQDVHNNCSEFLCEIACDIYFDICIGRFSGASNVGECSIYRNTTANYWNQNSITFGDSVQGMANPIIVKMARVPRHINIRVIVMDYDPDITADEKIDDITTIIQDVLPSVNGVKGSYRNVQLSNSDRAILNIKVRTYCNVHFYGDACGKLCRDNEYGHYRCNHHGDKVCNTGWTGNLCNKCTFCKNSATCIINNINGGYTCNCKEGYEGTHCENTKHKCVINPCKNGGTCLLNNNTVTEFTCICLSGWVGNRCDVKMDTTASTTTAMPTTKTPILCADDTYRILLQGVIDLTNDKRLKDGLQRLINAFAGDMENVYVKVTLRDHSSISAERITQVTFCSVTDTGFINYTIIDNIFKSHSEATINSYLPLPVYRSQTPAPDLHKEELPKASVPMNLYQSFTLATTDPIFWSELQRHLEVKQNSCSKYNWHAILIPVLIAVLFAICLIGVIVYRRKRKNTSNSTAYIDPLFDETEMRRLNDATDDGDVIRTPQVNTHPDGAERSIYTTLRYYDTPVKNLACQCTGVPRYQNSNLIRLDPRCQSATNHHTDFGGTSTRTESENSYEEISDA